MVPHAEALDVFQIFLIAHNSRNMFNAEFRVYVIPILLITRFLVKFYNIQDMDHK